MTSLTALINILGFALAISVLIGQYILRLFGLRFTILTNTAAVWSVIGFLPAITSLETPFLIQITLTGMVLYVAFHLAYIAELRIPEKRVSATAIIPVVVLLSGGVLVTIWTEAFFNEIVTPLDLSTVGIAASGLIFALILVAGWLSLDSAAPTRPAELIATLLVIIAFGMTLFLEIPTFGPALAAVSCALLGYAVLYPQAQQQTDDLKEELRVTRKDVQQLTLDLSDARKYSDTLSRRLQAANQYKDEFISNMSHELRTPLNSIIGYTELMLNGIYGKLNDKQQDRLQKVHENGTLLLNLVTDILDLNKIDSGTLELVRDRLAAVPLVKDVVDAYHDRCVEKNIELILNADDDLPSLYGDEMRVRQVVNHVIGNAVKFTEAGQVDVTIKAVLIEQGSTPEFQLPMIGWLKDGRWIIISVKDTGIGIEPEEQSHIFDTFMQVDGSHTREHGGTGLGLAIAKRLMDMHDGAIWVHSEPGAGSEFYLAFPVLTNITESKSSEGREPS